MIKLVLEMILIFASLIKEDNCTVIIIATIIITTIEIQMTSCCLCDYCASILNQIPEARILLNNLEEQENECKINEFNKLNEERIDNEAESAIKTLDRMSSSVWLENELYCPHVYYDTDLSFLMFLNLKLMVIHHFVKQFMKQSCRCFKQSICECNQSIVFLISDEFLASYDESAQQDDIFNDTQSGTPSGATGTATTVIVIVKTNTDSERPSHKTGHVAIASTTMEIITVKNDKYDKLCIDGHSQKQKKEMETTIVVLIVTRKMIKILLQQQDNYYLIQTIIIHCLRLQFVYFLYFAVFYHKQQQPYQQREHLVLIVINVDRSVFLFLINFQWMVMKKL